MGTSDLYRPCCVFPFSRKLGCQGSAFHDPPSSVPNCSETRLAELPRKSRTFCRLQNDIAITRNAHKSQVLPQSLDLRSRGKASSLSTSGDTLAPRQFCLFCIVHVFNQIRTKDDRIVEDTESLCEESHNCWGSFCQRCKNAVVETVSLLALNAEPHSFT
jgi:hypothetical protein